MPTDSLLIIFQKIKWLLTVNQILSYKNLHFGILKENVSLSPQDFLDLPTYARCSISFSGKVVLRLRWGDSNKAAAQKCRNMIEYTEINTQPLLSLFYASVV